MFYMFHSLPDGNSRLQEGCVARPTETLFVIFRQYLWLRNQSPWPQLPPLYNRKSTDCEKQAAIHPNSCWFNEWLTSSSVVKLTGAPTQNKARLDPKTRPSHLKQSQQLLHLKRTAFSLTFLGNPLKTLIVQILYAQSWGSSFVLEKRNVTSEEEARGRLLWKWPNSNDKVKWLSALGSQVLWLMVCCGWYFRCGMNWDLLQ